ncbi:hypothetical protein OG2516_13501 [Oceanicola granulosus HTCC2516]|uniref:Peptidase M48 domain-containing protein n=1 Tax=Oceanicola granulosus (strain ATCC BAA-861 / DSM 15982 / KCTC 12143 / HTCC2516) TaxID=314256 RepID=Q2CE47_OCEGH|nr:hypothetical protein [Oceanicola granulosus]EAR50891.1 hypothetical protein OG2516_13501 [Oceanicola granulosus HTCC2516]
MTALTRYARLESTGLWRPDPEAQRRDVIVSFGDATLVLSDVQGRPLTHWSLPAIERLNPGETPPLYGPDPDGLESLEVEDSDMVQALETIRRTVARARPRPYRLRLLGVAASVALVGALGVFWLPNALISQSLSAVPAVKRTEIGAKLLGHIQRLTGPSCRSPAGVEALAKLGARVFGPDAGGQIVVLPTQAFDALYLPGGIIAVSRALVEEHEDPAVVAGHVLATAAQVQQRDPLEAVLRDAGLRATFRLYTTGDVPTAALVQPAERLLAAPPPPPPAEVLVPLFAAAEIATSPYAYARDETGEETLELIEADPMAGRQPPLILSDADWIGLQGICGP